ncbi:MAG: zinc metallopeptidase [Christensenellaceae bacterium]|nr:zinc metallopeptidase [Christensenellaceae bacterium]
MFYPFYYYWDPSLLLLIPALIISIIAQVRVKSTYAKYSQIMTRFNVMNVQAANDILQRNGVYGVDVTIGGRALSDHYNPAKRTIRLSADPETYRSVAAVAVAAHECGHAIQHHEGYGPLKLRSALVPVVNFVSMLSWPLLIVGLIAGMTKLAMAAAVAYGAVVLFQLVTLPVEFNASKRALRALEGTGILTSEELVGAKKVLNAAALTYVAATLTAVAQMLRLLMIAGRRRN